MSEVPQTVLERATAAVEAEEKQVKMPYFHRVLSPEDQALLDRNKPKRIDTESSATDAVDTSTAAATAVAVTNTKLSLASAWNAAQSWEERDATKICHELLSMALEQSHEAFHSSTLGLVTLGVYIDETNNNVYKKNIDGNASVTHVRGKARFMYELSFELKFKYIPQSATLSPVVGGDNKEYKGKIKVIEATNDQPDDELDLSLEWVSTSNGGCGSPPGAATAIARKALLGKVMRQGIRSALNAFESAFKEL